MMKKILLTVFIFSIFQVVHTQKKELKTIDKQIRAGEYENALNTINSIKTLVDAADDKTKAKYYYLKGMARYQNGNGSFDNKILSIKDFNEVKKIELSGSKIYTSKVEDIISNLFNSFVLDGQTLLSDKNYVNSYRNFEAAYRVSPSDTLYLRNAALVALEGKFLEKALEYYLELIDLGFTGISMNYYATEKESGKEQSFQDKKQRDFSVDIISTHIDPRDELSESVEIDILRTVGAIYREKGNLELSLEYLDKAKLINPKDVNVLLLESTISYEMGNVEKYEDIIKSILELKPNDATLYYNLGVVNAQRKNYEKALEYYDKSIQIDPNYVNSYVNSGVAIMESRGPLIEEMDGLGMSTADYNRYDELKEEINILQRKAVVFFIKGFELNNTFDLAKQIKEIYYALDDTENGKKWEVIQAEIENN